MGLHKPCDSFIPPFPLSEEQLRTGTSAAQKPPFFNNAVDKPLPFEQVLAHSCR